MRALEARLDELVVDVLVELSEVLGDRPLRHVQGHPQLGDDVLGPGQARARRADVTGLDRAARLARELQEAVVEHHDEPSRARGLRAVRGVLLQFGGAHPWDPPPCAMRRLAELAQS